MDKKLIVLTIVIIIAILVWVVSLYLSRGGAEPSFSPSPALDTEDHADWNVFTSAEYGFSFKYPKTAFDEIVKLRQGYNDSNNVRFTVSITNPPLTGLIFRIKEKTDEFTDLRNYVEKEVANLKKIYSESSLWDEKEYPASITFDKVSVNNADGFLIKAVWTAENYTGMYYYFEKGDYLININYDYEIKNPELEKYDIIREIISTFKFID